MTNTRGGGGPVLTHLEERRQVGAGVVRGACSGPTLQPSLPPGAEEEQISPPIAPCVAPREVSY